MDINSINTAIRILSGAENADYAEFAAAKRTAVSGLRELKDYMAIGTVEECRKAAGKEAGKE